MHDEDRIATEPGVAPRDWHLLAPSEESRELATTCRAHFEKVFSPGVREWVSGAPVPGPLWQAVLDAGYLEVGLPAELDGEGTLLDLLVLLNEAGRALCPVPLLATSLAAQAQLAAGLRPADLARFRAAFGSGRGSVSERLVTAERIEVLDGAAAERLTLLITADDTAWLAVVDPGAPGLSVTAHRRDHDASRPMVTLSLDSVPALALAALTPGQAGRVLATVRACLAADLAGLAEGAVDRAIEHVRQRRQFGRYLGEFQAVKHLLADAHVETEKARSLTVGTVLGLLDGSGGHDGSASAHAVQLSLFASATATEAALRAASLYVQLLGAMGVTYEADAHLYLRRAHQTVLALDPPATAFRQAAEMERGIRR